MIPWVCVSAQFSERRHLIFCVLCKMLFITLNGPINKNPLGYDTRSSFFSFFTPVSLRTKNEELLFETDTDTSTGYFLSVDTLRFH